MQKRWLIYPLIGLFFGIADWFYLDWLASVGQNPVFQDSLFDEAGIARLFVIAIIVTLNYGIWLVPVIPAAVYEMKHSNSILQAAMAAVLVWSMAMVSYYTFYAFLLMFVGLPNLDFMLYSNRASPTYWSDWWPPFQRVILDQFLDWIVIALLGGAVAGALSGWVFKKITERRRKLVRLKA